LSSSTGALDRLLFALPRYVFQSPAYLAIYVDLLGQLPDATALMFLVHRSARAQLDGVLDALDAAGRATVIEVDDAMQFSTWVEDTFVVVNDGDETVLAAPVSLRRFDDARVTELVQGATTHRVRRTGLYFEGGNLLVGDDCWLLGGDHPLHALHLGLIEPRVGEAPLEAIRGAYGAALDSSRRLHLVRSSLPVPLQCARAFVLDGEPWTEVLYAGNLHQTVQPIFHIDMFVTLAGPDDTGRTVVLVGDPRAAAELLNEPLADHAMIDIFDDIAGGLAAEGLRVVRNPLPLVHDDDRQARRRKWYFATSNNALVQITARGREVWLPSYGHGDRRHLVATDAANRRLWEELGFAVHLLADCRALAFDLGGVHCLKKVLARTEHPSGDCRTAPTRPRSSA
jgi:hypothetical protein